MLSEAENDTATFSRTDQIAAVTSTVVHYDDSTFAPPYIAPKEVRTIRRTAIDEFVLVCHSSKCGAFRVNLGQYAANKATNSFVCGLLTFIEVGSTPKYVESMSVSLAPPALFSSSFGAISYNASFMLDADFLRASNSSSNPSLIREVF